MHTVVGPRIIGSSGETASTLRNKGRHHTVFLTVKRLEDWRIGLQKRRVAPIAFVVGGIFVLGWLIGQVTPTPLVAAVNALAYLPLVMHDLHTDTLPQPYPSGPTPTAVPGGPQAMMFGAADFGIKGLYIVAYGSGTPPLPPNSTPLPTPTGEVNPQNGAVHLPNGAEISHITIYYSGTSTLDATTRVELQRQQMESLETLATLSIPTDQAPGQDHVLQVAVAPGSVIIDNHIYLYRLAVYSTRDPREPFNAYHIRIDYRLPTDLASR
jgi:hypothetical protein